MAGAIELTEVDFDKIKQNLIDYLKSTRKFSDFDFEGSNLQVILNLISYQAQLNAYATNMIANESFLASSSIRNNVVANAHQVGYVPTSKRAAKAYIDFEFVLEPDQFLAGFPTFLQVEPGMTFNTGTGTTSFTFNTIDTHVSAVDKTGLCRFIQIPVYEGIRLQEKFTVEEDNYTQRFILRNQNIDTTTIRVEVQEDPNEEIDYFYKEADNLVSLTEESRVYWIKEIDDEYYQLDFGDGYFGKKLQNGARITVTYLITNGELANGIQGASSFIFTGTVRDSFGANYVSRPFITSTSVTEGGSEIEDVPSIKYNAPKSYAAQNRCVVADDYESIIRKAYPSVDDIYVYGGETLEIPEYGRVYVCIKPKQSEKLSNISKNYIKNSLEPFRVASLDIRLTDPEILYAEISSVVYFNEKATNKDSANIVAVVNETLTKYSESSTVSKFGGTVRYSRIVGAIDESDQSITRNLTSMRMRRNMTIVENTDASYEVCFENAFKLDCNNPVIYSTSFKLDLTGTTDPRDFYFEDDTQGNIRLFYFDEFNNKVITNKEFGTVDYEKGEVKIGYQKPVKFVSTTELNSAVKIRALPREMDIEAKHNMYLDFDVAESDIQAVVDAKIAKS